MAGQYLINEASQNFLLDGYDFHGKKLIFHRGSLCLI